MAGKRKKVNKKEAENNKDLFPEISKPQSPKSFLTLKTGLLIAILIIVAFLWKFKNMFIVATVNNQPISRWQLNNQLVKRFGDQTLDNIINERLILAVSRQKGIFISANEIDARIKEIEKKLEGKMTIDDALAAQGLTKEDFKRQIEIQISIDKLFEKDASVSAKEIDEYIANNSSAYKDATDPAKVKEDVINILRQQKITELFDTWFTDIRKNAKINKFL